MLGRDRPPHLDVSPSWRDLYAAGAFAQRELNGDGPLSRQADERNVRLGIGQSPLEELDLKGSLQPIAFAESGYWSGFELPAIPPDDLTFREREEALPWKNNYAWESDGYPTVSPLYSPWQILYLDDLVSEGKAQLGLNALLLPSEKREGTLEKMREFYEHQERDYRRIDADWRPLLKVLVSLQNHYWPMVSGRVTLLPDPTNQSDWVEAGRDGVLFDPQANLDWLGCSKEQLTEAYQFLVMRGVDREPRDGLVMLRRARPRPFHIRWRGNPRRAQDNFDAAEVLRLFLLDLGGDVGPPEGELMDGRQAERRALFDHGPAAAIGREELKAELLSAELYPHGVEAIVEGPSEIRIIETIVGSLLGPAGLGETGFFDLEGVGAAKQVAPLAESLGAYAIRTLVVVDREGRMGSYVEQMIDREEIEPEDVCLWENDLESDNSSPSELIELAAEIVASPVEDVPAVELSISAEELVAAQAKRNQGRSAKKQAGIAEVLVSLIDGHDPPARLRKPELAEALGVRIVGEFTTCEGDEQKLAEIYARRPILRFVVKRLIGAINRSVPVA